jgi:hypothetical protein
MAEIGFREPRYEEDEQPFRECMPGRNPEMQKHSFPGGEDRDCKRPCCLVTSGAAVPAV